jgi:polyhydroxyalkanoate synthesis repressor PhaR
MTRVITRYRGGSRKLYDTAQSRYISLDEIPDLIRRGDVLRVVDNASGADVTGQVLAQVISESERRGVSFLSSEALHEIIRSGERLLADGVRTLRREMDRLLAPPRESAGRARGSRGELDLLRHGLRQLEQSLTTVGHGAHRSGGRRRPRRVRSAGAARTRIRTDVEEQ